MADLPKVRVYARIHDQNGAPVSGARVGMRLTTMERYGGLIVPRETSQITDRDGLAVLEVFPNELGSEGSEYLVTVSHSVSCQSVCGNGGLNRRFYVSVPNSDCNLTDIANLPPYEQRGAGQLIPSEVAFQASQAANAADRCQSILEELQGLEATFSRLGSLAETAKRAAQNFAAKAENHEQAAQEAVARFEESVAHFENGVVGRTETAANALVAEATARVTRAKADALENIERRSAENISAIENTGASVLAGARNRIRNDELAALERIADAGNKALEALKEEAALFNEDFEALLERALAAAKRAACSAAAASLSATKACQCAERAELAERNIKALIFDAASSIVTDEIIAEAAERARKGALESAKAVWGPLAEQIIRLTDRHTEDTARLERDKVKLAIRHQEMLKLSMRLNQN